MTAEVMPKAITDRRTAPGDELTRLRHAQAVVVLTLATDPEIKQVVLETVTAAGRRPPQPREPVEH